ncbi:MAG TPA: glycosyltransferase family 39 protein [Patescibacteria group bacterium]|nr:glycosyltransferase family 39 protein [Patescibacteria group bacterium]
MKKIFLNNKFILLFIILIAAFLRLYQLGVNPPSLTWDEVAWGYNAYSLGIDGKDEFGRFLPHDYLESFGDFKPPVYAYLDIIPVKMFGLNAFSTRLPSAVFGILTVLMTYFLVREIFPKDKKESEFLALATSSILAISPWHIMLSRAAFEANVSTFFIVTGVWAFLASVQGKRWLLVLSAISFVISMYTFNTARIVSPLLVFILALSFRKQLLANKKATIAAVVVGLLLILPTVQFLVSPQAGLRFKEVNIFSDVSVVKRANQEIANSNNSLISKLVDNRRVLYGIEYVKHYFDNLTPRFLFISGDGNPKFSTQTVGQMYIWEIIFFVAGILFLFRKRQGNWWLVPVWLLVGIVPAATARETPHALRIETTLPTFQILVAYGIFWLGSMLFEVKSKIAGIKLSKAITFVFVIVIFANFFYFWRDYTVNYKYDYSGEWQYGYEDSINYVKSVQDKYDYIQVTNALGRPYIYYLFYNKTNPGEFRNEAKINRDPFGFVDVEGFGKYKFPNDFEVGKDKNKKVLYIATPYKLPENARVLKTFYLLDGKPVLVAYEI